MQKTDTRDRDLIPGLGRSPGVGNGNPLQFSCLGNPMDRGVWQASVQGVAKSQTKLSIQVHGSSLTVRCMGSVVVAWGLSYTAVSGILIPFPGIKPSSPVLKGRLNHWTTREIPILVCIYECLKPSLKRFKKTLTNSHDLRIHEINYCV